MCICSPIYFFLWICDFFLSCVFHLYTYFIFQHPDRLNFISWIKGKFVEKSCCMQNKCFINISCYFDLFLNHQCGNHVRVFCVRVRVRVCVQHSVCVCVTWKIYKLDAINLIFVFNVNQWAEYQSSDWIVRKTFNSIQCNGSLLNFT